jgi:hypothetical protein
MGNPVLVTSRQPREERYTLKDLRYIFCRRYIVAFAANGEYYCVRS